MKTVKVHCGSAHVRGQARSYRYFVASLFVTRQTKGGSLVWANTGRSTHPRRSRRLAEADGRELARHHAATFTEGYGSLHNRPAPKLDKIEWPTGLLVSLRQA